MMRTIYEPKRASLRVSVGFELIGDALGLLRNRPHEANFVSISKTLIPLANDRVLVFELDRLIEAFV